MRSLYFTIGIGSTGGGGSGYRGTHSTKVSVIIPTHNRASLLTRAIYSVLCQTFSDYEIIIVDDCSSDNTQEILSGFANLSIHSFRHEQRRGASAARNTGIAQARGEYIAFLDDDDEWLPTKLEEQVNLLEVSSPNVALVYGWLDRISDSSGRMKQGPRKTTSGDAFDDLLSLTTIAPTSTLLVRSSAIRDIGGFDESLPRGNDADLISRLSRRYQIAVLPKVVVKYHTDHGHSRISDNTPERLTNHVEYIRTHIENFSTELNEHPRALSAVLRQLAVAEMMCANRSRALSIFLKALRIGSVRSIGLVDTLRLVKAFIWYATPFSHFRHRIRAMRDRLL